MPPETLILAFDTSAAYCAAALLCDGRIIADALTPMEKGQSEALLPMLEQVLLPYTWANLTAIAVGTGPGNFTGVRIAVSLARGLTMGLNIPAIGVTRLEALAHGLPRPITVIEDARRGAIYLQGFGTPDETARLLDLSDLTAACETTLATGSAAPNPVAPAMPLTHAIAHIAASRLGTATPRPAPFYLRGADAAPPSDPPPTILP
ncbi:MAG: tRNA ((37)-N6)-threonylcarbamoyltransferase complex dimerization subunit type 1 TsaB [Pseudomonadota bacterium]